MPPWSLRVLAFAFTLAIITLSLVAFLPSRPPSRPRKKKKLGYVDEALDV
jgi:hypothetical protein